MENTKLRMAAIICFTIISIVTLIGISFGKEGLLNIGIAIMIISIISLFVLASSLTSKMF